MELSAEVGGISFTWVTLRRCDGCGLCDKEMGDRVDNRNFVLLKRGKKLMAFNACSEPEWGQLDVRAILEHIRHALACPTKLNDLRSDEAAGYVNPALGRATINLAEGARRFLSEARWRRLFELVEAQPPTVSQSLEPHRQDMHVRREVEAPTREGLQVHSYR